MIATQHGPMAACRKANASGIIGRSQTLVLLIFVRLPPLRLYQVARPDLFRVIAAASPLLYVVRSPGGRPIHLRLRRLGHLSLRAGDCS